MGSDEDRSGCLDTALSSQRFGGEERGLRVERTREWSEVRREKERARRALLCRIAPDARRLSTAPLQNN